MTPVPPADIRREAEDFLDTIAHEKHWSAKHLASRKETALAEIEQNGIWNLEFKELEHGARMAWRNNARCIGRLFWSSLKVRDLRDMSDPDHINTALLEHLDYGTNGGKIQPLITIFAPSTSEGPAVRIWNHQLLGYAGYEQPDGTILGDPKNVTFTREAQKLGWQGAGTRFDLLPWIIQKRGEAPRLYPAPNALEVAIEHPDFSWFAELGLRWYAVPILSDMVLRIGGVDFPAAPFNGWYMGTEIGARNLADADRYNLLPAVADLLGLDRRHPRTLWKDRALLELNAAVLHSFAAAGVTLVDHHSASEEFLRFCTREEAAGRAVSARWDWIVPPISASATRVFHTPMREFPTTPDFHAQPPPAGLA